MLSSTSTTLLALQLLDLEDNGLSDWAEVMRVSQLPYLRHLWLGGNELHHIQLPPGTPLGSCLLHNFCHLIRKSNVLDNCTLTLHFAVVAAGWLLDHVCKMPLA